MAEERRRGGSEAVTSAFDAIKRDRQARAIRRAVEFLLAGEEAMGHVCDAAMTHGAGGDDARLSCYCEPSEMEEVRLALADLADEMERGK